jgi:glycosyltransferase involved in cell wall biosynthesis
VESGRHLYGGPRQVAYLIEALDRRGLENILICPPGHELATRAGPALLAEMPMHGDLDVGITARLRRLLARLRPDVVHVHSRRGADVFGGRACRDGPPAVLTRRVDDPELRAWARWKYRPYRFVVAISTAVRAQVCASAGLDAARVPVIASAVDTAAFRPHPDARPRLLREFGLPQSAFVMIVAAQLIPRKGHEFLLRTLPELRARHPQLHVLCFGRGALRERLGRALKTLRLETCVHFVDYRDDFRELLPGADLLVHVPSREGLGVAVLEAMSCAVPLVATRIGGIPDAVTDGREGLLVPYGDGCALVAALRRMIDDAGGRAQMGAAGRVRVERDFSVARMGDRYIDVYRAAEHDLRAAV